MSWPRPDRIDREDGLIATLGAIPFLIFMALVIWFDLPGNAP